MKVIGIMKVFMVALLGAIVFLFWAKAEAAVVDRIVAVVNNEIVTLSDLERAFEPYRAKVEANYKGNDRQNAIEDAKRELLDQIVNEMLMKQEAKKTGISVTDGEVDEAIENIAKSRGMSLDGLQKLFRREGFTMKEYKKNIRDQIMRMKLIGRDIKSKVAATDEEIGEYYRKHREEYDGNESVRIRQIFIPVKEDVTAGRKAEIRAEAEFIHKRLLAGESFEALCAKFSKGPGSEEGGDIGYIEKGSIMPEIESVAFSLPLRKISDVIETAAGFHIIQVTDRRGAGIKGIEVVREEIKAAIDREKTEKKFEAWLKEIREKSNVEIRL